MSLGISSGLAEIRVPPGHRITDPAEIEPGQHLYAGADGWGAEYRILDQPYRDSEGHWRVKVERRSSRRDGWVEDEICLADFNIPYDDEAEGRKGCLVKSRICI